MFGGTGINILFGGSGNDLLVGGANNDYLYGGTGSDTLSAGAGTNLLQSGSGPATFLFSTMDAAQNTLDGFRPGTDHFDVTGASGTLLGTAALQAILNSATTDASGNAVLAPSATNTLTLEGIFLSDLNQGIFGAVLPSGIPMPGGQCYPERWQRRARLCRRFRLFQCQPWLRGSDSAGRQRQQSFHFRRPGGFQGSDLQRFHYRKRFYQLPRFL